MNLTNLPLALVLTLLLTLSSTTSFAQVKQSYFTDMNSLQYNQVNPQNPSMASHDNNMHVDSYATDVHPGPGPVGFTGHSKRFDFGLIAGECAGILFDKNYNIMTVCVRMGSTQLLLMDPKNFSIIARYDLPARPNVLLAAVTLQFEKLMDDTSGGSYFFIDHQNRAVIATSDRTILVISQVSKDNKIHFKLEQTIDLKKAVPQTHCASLTNPDFTDRRCDKVTTVLPDFQGNYWFISRYGKIGVIDHKTGEITIKQLPQPEELQNSFSLDKSGAYIVSTHALYHLRYDKKTGIKIAWRESYDRGTGRKLGQVNQGSGTSPSLMGEKFVSISDNAFPRMNVLVYRRGELAPGEDRLVCKLPVFKDNASATENSFVVFNNSIIVENNYGYKGPLSDSFTPGGVVRIDIDADEKGCHIVWESDIIAPTSVAKLSVAYGIVYFYTKDANLPKDQITWSLTGLDFNTGAVMTQIKAGVGNAYNNNWGAISLAPDGSAYIGSFKGFIKIQNALGN